MLFNEYSEFVYCCRKCNAEFQTGPYLEAHILSEHQDQKRQIFVNDGIFIGDQIFESQPDELVDNDENGLMEEDDSGHCDEYQNNGIASNASDGEQANEEEEEENEEEYNDEEEEEAASTESDESTDEREEEESSEAIEVAETEATQETEPSEETEATDETAIITNESAASEEVLDAHSTNEFTVTGETVSVANNEQAMIEQVENAAVVLTQDDNHATVENGSTHETHETHDSVNIVNESVENAVNEVIATEANAVEVVEAATNTIEVIETAVPKKRKGRPPGSKNKKKPTESIVTNDNEAQNNATPTSNAQDTSVAEMVVTAPKKRLGRPPGSKNKENIVRNNAANEKTIKSKTNQTVDVSVANNSVAETVVAVPKKRMGRPPGSKNKDKENIIINNAATRQQKALEAQKQETPKATDTQKQITFQLRDRSKICKKRRYSSEYEFTKPNPRKQRKIAADAQTSAQTQNAIESHDGAIDSAEPETTKTDQVKHYSLMLKIDAIELQNDLSVAPLLASDEECHEKPDTTTPVMNSEGSNDEVSSSSSPTRTDKAKPVQVNVVSAEEAPAPAKRRGRPPKKLLEVSSHTVGEQNPTHAVVEQATNNGNNGTKVNNVAARMPIFQRWGVYHCDMCPGESFDGKANLHNHMKKHIPRKLKQCPLCGKFPKKYDYHMEAYHSPFECKFCHAIFRTSKAHKLHVRTHTGER